MRNLIRCGLRVQCHCEWAVQLYYCSVAEFDRVKSWLSDRILLWKSDGFGYVLRYQKFTVDELCVEALFEVCIA